MGSTRRPTAAPAACPGRGGTLGQTRWSPIAEALRAKINR